MSKRKRRTEDARYHRLDFSTKRPADADVIGFADWLAVVFGSRRQAVASILRATALYTRWRRQVEQCPVCNAFVRIASSWGTDRMTTLCDHEWTAGNKCRGSGQAVKWDGDRLSLDDMLAAIAAEKGIDLDPDPFTGNL